MRLAIELPEKEFAELDKRQTELAIIEFLTAGEAVERAFVAKSAVLVFSQYRLFYLHLEYERKRQEQKHTADFVACRSLPYAHISSFGVEKNFSNATATFSAKSSSDSIIISSLAAEEALYLQQLLAGFLAKCTRL